MRRSRGTPVRSTIAFCTSMAPRTVDHAAKLDERPIAGALEDTPVVHGDGGIDEIATERSQPRQSAILVRAGEPTEADDISCQYRCKLPGLGHNAPHASCRIAQ